ncbi:hypothetical protein D3C71_1662060 [compost metagenome]
MRCGRAPRPNVIWPGGTQLLVRRCCKERWRLRCSSLFAQPGRHVAGAQRVHRTPFLIGCGKLAAAIFRRIVDPPRPVGCSTTSMRKSASGMRAACRVWAGGARCFCVGAGSRDSRSLVSRGGGLNLFPQLGRHVHSDLPSGTRPPSFRVAAVAWQELLEQVLHVDALLRDASATTARTTASRLAS